MSDPQGEQREYGCCGCSVVMSGTAVVGMLIVALMRGRKNLSNVGHSR